MSPRTTPSDERTEWAVEKLAAILASPTLSDVSARYAALADQDRKGGHNGLNGYEPSARGSILSDMPSGGGSASTATERLALGRPALDPIRDLAETARVQIFDAYHALVELAATLDRHTALVTPEEGGDQRCQSCETADVWADPAERFRNDDGTYRLTDVAGRLDEPWCLCDWCYQYLGKNDRLPSPRLVRDHAEGRHRGGRPRTTTPTGHRL